ncbi:MAG: hypothetical protein ACKN9T_01725 [Candidatus Methylumidiphilus sp.]
MPMPPAATTGAALLRMGVSNKNFTALSRFPAAIRSTILPPKQQAQVATVSKWRIVGMVNLAVVLAVAGAFPANGQGLPPVAEVEAPGDVEELRAWLNRRNQERKKLGLAVPETPKKRVAALAPPPHPKPPQRPATPPSAIAEPAEAAAEQATPVLHIGRGPDGRIHVRYLLKDEGPDQVQVYTPADEAEPSAEDPAKLERLTARGKRAWLAGSALRSHPHARRER